MTEFRPTRPLPPLPVTWATGKSIHTKPRNNMSETREVNPKQNVRSKAAALESAARRAKLEGKPMGIWHNGSELWRVQPVDFDAQPSGWEEVRTVNPNDHDAVMKEAQALKQPEKPAAAPPAK